MPDRSSTRPAARAARTAARAVALLAASLLGCAGLTSPQRTPKIDQVSRSGEAFAAFLQSPGMSMDEIRQRMPAASADSVYLVDEAVPNAALGAYIEREACEYPFEIFLRVTVSTEDGRVHRYLVKGDWRSVKMGYGTLIHPELYDAIYLHTHPRDKRVIPNSIADYIHAEVFRGVSTLLVGDGIPIEFESIPPSGDRVDRFDVDGRSFSIERPEREPIRQRKQWRHEPRDASEDARELDRVFRQSVSEGHARVALRNSDGMLVVYERDRSVRERLDEVYREAGLRAPSERDGVAASNGTPEQSPSDASPTLGY